MCGALQPGAASSGGGRGALAAAAAREAALRVASLCLAFRVFTFSRFVEPSASTTSARRPLLRPDVRRFLGARELRRAPPAVPAAAAAAPRVARVAATAVSPAPARERLRVSAAVDCSRTNAQMAWCSRRTSSSRSRRAVAAAAASSGAGTTRALFFATHAGHAKSSPSGGNTSSGWRHHL